MSSSPYQTPESSLHNAIPPSMPLPQLKPPAAIKIFGILHIVFGSFGLLCNIGSAAAMTFIGKLSPSSMPGEVGSSLGGILSYMGELT